MKSKNTTNKKLKITLTSIFILNIGLVNTALGKDGIPDEPIPPIPSEFKQDAQSCVKSESSVVPGNESGALLVGTVVADPWYVKGHNAKHSSVVLSHTHILIEPFGESSATDEYEMAADNIFAIGYDNAESQKQVPSPLNQLVIGTKVEVCGFTYTQKPSGKSQAEDGIHWVHIANKDGTKGGWVKIINPDGIPGNNLESNTEYLYLWPPVRTR